MACMTPHRVAVKAAAIMGPRVEGVDRFCRTCSRPMTVPMMPMVGAKPAMSAKNLAPALWRDFMASRSCSRMSLISSGSEPSTAISMPLRRKVSSIWRASSSRARSPCRRAFSAKETTTATASSGAVTLAVRADFRILGRFLASLMSMPATAAPDGPAESEQYRRRCHEGGRVTAVHDHGYHEREQRQAYADKARWVHVSFPLDQAALAASPGVGRRRPLVPWPPPAQKRGNAGRGR